ncbi:MAG TPA: hypothetical protein VFA67_05680 [Candidatus Sulfotelmatobacter sp.]|nr:hypothetical protein [Candidatus Sulfotelmatobacter sp.]
MEPSVQRRHGTRVRAQIPVRLTSLDPQSRFSERCHTLLVNPNGCGLRVSRPLKPGMLVRMDDLPGGGTVIARVASNLPPRAGSKYWVVGLGMNTPGNIWRLAPTPDDWDT